MKKESFAWVGMWSQVSHVSNSAFSITCIRKKPLGILKDVAMVDERVSLWQRYKSGLCLQLHARRYACSAHHWTLSISQIIGAGDIFIVLRNEWIWYVHSSVEHIIAYQGVGQVLSLASNARYHFISCFPHLQLLSPSFMPLKPHWSSHCSPSLPQSLYIYWPLFLGKVHNVCIVLFFTFFRSELKRQQFRKVFPDHTM